MADYEARGYQRAGRSALALLLAALLTLLCGCAPANHGYQKNSKLDASQNVRLVIVGSWKDCRGFDLVAEKFHELYPNCVVEYEYLQDYKANLAKRVYSQDDRADLFIASNIQDGSPHLDYALDLLEYPKQVSLSDTFPGLVYNYRYVQDDGTAHLYSVPLGGEVRGLYVNTTLLSSLHIAVPVNRAELVAACRVLRDAGYIPLQDNPASFGQRMLFPYIAHMITCAEDPEAMRAMLINCGEGCAELFRDPIAFLYELVSKDYYNYKYVETVDKRFLDLSDEGMARSFLNIVEKDGGFVKADDLGAVPFMTASDSLLPAINKAKEDYHSKIEYQFILVPVTDQGGFAYMSPNNGIAVNKHSFHVDWALEFVNFFFTAENNKIAAQAQNLTPNTADALEIISKKFGISMEHIGQPQDVTFSNYNFYNVINPTLIGVSKANNPKYMQEDASGERRMYPLEHYINGLQEAFEEQRKAVKE